MGFTFIGNSVSTDKKVTTEIMDYGARVSYPVSLTLSVNTGDGYHTQHLSFYTREVARESIIELIGKCQGWLADELGVHRDLPPPEEVWPEAEAEAIEEKTLSTDQPRTHHKTPGSIGGPGGAR